MKNWGRPRKPRIRFTVSQSHHSLLRRFLQNAEERSYIIQKFLYCFPAPCEMAPTPLNALKA